MYEANRDLLTLCYEDVKEIRDGYYIVKLGHNYGVVDANNNVILDFNFKEIESIGDFIYALNSGTYRVYWADTFKVVNNADEIYDIRKIHDKAYLFYKEYGRASLVSNRGKELIPCVIKNAWIYKETSNKIYIKTSLAYGFESRHHRSVFDTTENNGNLSYVIADKNMENVDCYCAFETGIPSVQIVISSENKNYSSKFDYDYRFKYRIRKDGNIVSKEYGSISVRMSLSNYGLLQTYDISEGRVTCGIVSIDGEEQVPVGKYSSVDYIGNRVYIVKGDSGYGTYYNGQSVVEVGELEFTYISSGVPITCAVKNGKRYIIGNDGNIYDSIEKAFPFYKSTIDSNINLMNMYGNWICLDNRLNLVSIQDSRIRSRDNWVKI